MIQRTTLRVYQLIQLLSTKPYYNKKRLADVLQVSTKTVGRYFDFLEQLNFVIEQDFEGRYFIAVDIYPAEKGIQLTWQETELLGQLLQTDATHHTLKGDILKKLFIPEKFHPLAGQLLNGGHSPKIDKLAQAISQRKQVVLVQYSSNHSGTTRDRWVEPLELSVDYGSLSAYEPESDQQKQFRVDRMDAVKILETPITFQGDIHQADFFGFIGKPFTIQLHLNMQAYQLLTTEYPATQVYIRTKPEDIPGFRRDYPYYFEALVRDHKGIGRFLLGIMGDVIVAAPQSLKDYLNERREGWKF